MGKLGLFIGLVTLDFIYLTEFFPQSNQKIVASDYAIAAGGPATNAAITFSYLGNNSQLMGVVGMQTNSQVIKADLSAHQVKLIDLEPNRQESPPISSIIVTKSTGERAVISINATKAQGSLDKLPSNLLDDIEIVLIDGHQMVASATIVSQAQGQQIPVIMDGGSWKPGLETILPYIDYAICSANFFPPGCETTEDVFSYLQAIGIDNIAITQGEKPILYDHQGTRGEIPIPPLQAIDTLGAGDIFHGAFCHYLWQQDFVSSLIAASKIASRSCRYFGTRRWMAQDN